MQLDEKELRGLLLRITRGAAHATHMDSGRRVRNGFTWILAALAALIVVFLIGVWLLDGM